MKRPDKPHDRIKHASKPHQNRYHHHRHRSRGGGGHTPFIPYKVTIGSTTITVKSGDITAENVST